MIAAQRAWHTRPEAAVKNFRMSIARQAIVDWLRARRRVARCRAVLDYATKLAGTPLDLDPALESAGIEELLRLEGSER